MKLDIKPGQVWRSQNGETVHIRSVDPLTQHACCGFKADPVWYVDLVNNTGRTQRCFTTSYIWEWYTLQ